MSAHGKPHEHASCEVLERASFFGYVDMRGPRFEEILTIGCRAAPKATWVVATAEAVRLHRLAPVPAD